MENFLSKKQLKVILEQAPKGADQTKIINGLVSKGYKLEGFNDQPIKVENTMTGSDKATFQATGNEGIIGGTAKAIGNLPSSSIQLGKNVLSAVTHPIDTIKSVGTLVKGTGAKVGEILLEDTGFGQKLLQKTNEKRIAQGLPELPKDASGKIQAIDTPELQAINQVGQFFKDRYGSMEKFKETAIEDPAGVLADVATLLTGGSAALAKAGQITKIAEITNAANKISSLANKVEPISAITSGVSKGSDVIKSTTAGRIAGEVIPTATDIQRSQVVKALDLTQGDLATIGKKTGNDVTEFIVSKGLIKDTPEAVADALDAVRKNTMKLVRDEISRVNKIYDPTQIPRVKDGLTVILKGVDEVSGLESTADEIRSILSKDKLTLSDVQRAKELIDENSNIYSKIGDVKSSSTARGLDTIRGELKSFIENEVSSATNGQTNISKLNNDVQTSYAIEDAINTRATRNLTRQKVSLGDMAALFGGGSMISPAFGVGLYIGKKIIETPSFRLGFVKALNAQPIEKVKRILTEVKNKNVSKETQKLLNDLADQARKNVQLVETGSAITDKNKEKK